MAHVAVAVPVTDDTTALVRVTRNGTRLQPLIPCLALSPGAARPYGVNLAAKNDSSRYMCVFGDGATTTWAADDGFEAAGEAAQLDQADVIAPAALRVVCLVNGAPIPNAGTDVAAGAGDFWILAADGGTLETGTTYAAGTKIELFVCDAADVVDVVGAAMDANVPEEIEAYDIMGSVTAAYSVMI